MIPSRSIEQFMSFICKKGHTLAKERFQHEGSGDLSSLSNVSLTDPVSMGHASWDHVLIDETRSWVDNF